MKTRKLMGAALAAALCLSAAGCADKKDAGQGSMGPDAASVLAVVNSGRITVEDFKSEAAGLPPYAQKALADPKGREKLLENLVSKELIVQDAKKMGLEKDPEVEKRVKRLLDNLLLGMYVQKEVFDKATVADGQVKEYFDKNKDKLGAVRISHIVVESEDAAEEVLVKYKAGDSFSRLAQRYSLDGQTKGKGGDLGFIQWSEFGSPDLKEAAFSIPLGEVSNVVQSAYGYHIIKVTDRKPATDAEYEKVKEAIGADLLEKKKEELFEARVKQLRDKATVTQNDDAVKDLSLVEIPQAGAAGPQ